MARKHADPFYLAAGVMLVADFLVMYKNYLAYHELRFNWLVFNVYVVSIMGATLALAGKPVMPYILAFAAGAMLYAVVEELVPEASQGEHSNIATVGFAVGFALMMVLDVVMG